LAAKEQGAATDQAAARAATDQAATDQAAARAKEQAAKEQAAKEQAAFRAKEQAAARAREQAAKEQAAARVKEQAAKEQAAREQAAKEQAAARAKEQAAKEQAAKEQAAKEQAAARAKEQAAARAREHAAKEQAAARAREQAPPEQVLQDQILSAVRTGQEATLHLARTWVETFVSVTPNLFDPRTVPNLRDYEGFAERLLSKNHDFPRRPPQDCLGLRRLSRVGAYRAYTRGRRLPSLDQLSPPAAAVEGALDAVPPRMWRGAGIGELAPLMLSQIAWLNTCMSIWSSWPSG